MSHDIGTGSEPETIKLDPEQFVKLARLIGVAVVRVLAETHAVGRSGYSVAEVARRANLSETFVRQDILAGKLRVVRPGGRSAARVLPADEARWLEGRTKPEDAPAEGLSPDVVMRNKVRGVIGSALRKGRKVNRA